MKKSTSTFSLIAVFVAVAFTALSQPVANFSWPGVSVCPNKTIQITDQSTPAGSITAWGYSVTGATGTTYTVQNPVITFTGSGTQTITLIVLQGITPSAPTTKTVNLLVPPAGTVNTTNMFPCSGQSVTLTATAPGGLFGYTWTPGGLNTPSINITPTTNVTYSVVVMGGNSCFSTLTVTQPIASLSVSSTSSMLCSGQSATLTASGSASYSWQPGGQTTASVVVTPTANATYTVTNATCSLSSMFTQSVTSCTGIQELSGGAISVVLQPNPAGSELNIKSGLQMENIQVLDITGRVIYSSMNVNSQEVHLNISSFAKGIYYVRIQSGNATETRKLVKE
jgi:PKD repeat protein